MTKLYMPELAKLLDKSIPKRITEANEVFDEVLARQDNSLASFGRWASKQTLRLGLGIAMARVSKYSASMLELPGCVWASVPEIAEDIDYLEQFYLKAPDDVASYQRVVEIADRMIIAAVDAGIIKAN